jgi:DUF218 domain-containing protein
MRTAIVVPGHARRGRISEVCVSLVREAERLAAAADVVAVVFSGGSVHGGEPEAEQMRAVWHGPQVEVVVEPTAGVTAENAASSARSSFARRCIFTARASSSRGCTARPASRRSSVPSPRDARSARWHGSSGPPRWLHASCARRERS